jgi:hypothetical protein
MENFFQQCQGQVVAVAGEQFLHLCRRGIGVVWAPDPRVDATSLDVALDLKRIQMLANCGRRDAQQLLHLFDRSGTAPLEIFNDLPQR